MNCTSVHWRVCDHVSNTLRSYNLLTPFSSIRLQGTYFRASSGCHSIRCCCKEGSQSWDLLLLESTLQSFILYHLSINGSLRSAQNVQNKSHPSKRYSDVASFDLQNSHAVPIRPKMSFSFLSTTSGWALCGSLDIPASSFYHLQLVFAIQDGVYTIWG